MTYPIFFEIGGHVVETYVANNHFHAPLRPRSDPVHHMMKEEHGVPKTMTKHALKSVSPEGYDLNRAAQGYGRARRARWAFSTAAALAAADGPLPFGDIAAIGLLGFYGAYEGIHAFGDFLQN